MNPIEKQLRKIPAKFRGHIFDAIECIMLRDFSELDRKKLKGYADIFRVRVGNYRIIYFDNGSEIILKAIKRRDESTYNAF